MQDSDNWTEQNWVVRNSIMSMPGARKCPDCSVITQGGADAYRAHRNQCHPEITNGAA